jgi:hypothetical protein
VTDTFGKESASIMGEALASYNRRPRTFSAGRLCHFDGCTTRLSIYNSSNFCGTHDGYRSEMQAPAIEGPAIEGLSNVDELSNVNELSNVDELVTREAG